MDFSATLIQSLDQPYVLAQYPSYKNYLEIKYLCHYMSSNELLRGLLELYKDSHIEFLLVQTKKYVDKD